MGKNTRPAIALLLVFALSCILCSGSATLIAGWVWGQTVLTTFAAMGMLFMCTAAFARIVLGKRNEIDDE